MDTRQPFTPVDAFTGSSHGALGGHAATVLRSELLR